MVRGANSKRTVNLPLPKLRGEGGRHAPFAWELLPPLPGKLRAGGLSAWGREIPLGPFECPRRVVVIGRVFHAPLYLPRPLARRRAGPPAAPPTGISGSSCPPDGPLSP